MAWPPPVQLSAQPQAATAVTIDGRKVPSTEFFAEVVEQRFAPLDSTRRLKVVEEFALRRIFPEEVKKRKLEETPAFAEAMSALKRQLTVDAITEEEVWGPVLSDSSLRVLYGRMGKKIGVHHILVGFKGAARAKTERSEEEALAVILEIRDKLVKGELKFPDAAKQYSEDFTRDKYGDLGGFTWGKLFEPVQTVAWRLKEGELSEPVRSDYGYHLVRVVFDQPIQQKPFEESVPMLKAFLRGRNGHEFKLALTKYEAGLREQFAVVFNWDLLDVIWWKELVPLKEKRGSELKAVDLLSIESNGVVCSAGGELYDVRWFQRQVEGMKELLSKSLMPAREAFLQTLEDLLYRELVTRRAGKTRDAAWFVGVDEKAASRKEALYGPLVFDEMRKKEPGADEEKLKGILLKQHQVKVDGDFIRSYEKKAPGPR